MNWKKPQTIIGTILSGCALVGVIFTVYNHFVKQEDFELFAQEVYTEYVKEDEILAVNKNVQQTNYEFWIYKSKQEINDLYKELRVTTDAIKQVQIREQIEEKKQELKNYLDKLNDLR